MSIEIFPRADQGREFDNGAVREWCSLNGVELYLIPKSPWAAGSIERRHRTVKEALERLKAIYGPTSQLHPRLVRACVDAVNVTPSSSLYGLSPFQIQFVKNAHTDRDPEDSTGPQLSSLLKSDLFESYELRKKARAVIEDLRTDTKFLQDLAQFGPHGIGLIITT